MGHWGWRRIVVTIFVSVWVAGCNLVGDSPSTEAAPTAYPMITLTTGRLGERASPLLDGTQIAMSGENTPVTTSAAGHTLPVDFSTPTALPLRLEPPLCAPAPNGIACLGQVANTTGIPVQRVMIEVRLLRPNGAPPMIEQVAAEQILIPSGGSAPYRALFPAPWETFTGATAVLQSADPSPADSFFVALTVEDQRLELAGGQVNVSGVIVNPYADNIYLLRAVITLQNASGTITTYRVVDLEQELLPSGGGAMLQVAIGGGVNQDGSLPRATMYVEGRRAQP